MQNLNRTNSFSFVFIASLILITAGLALAVSFPTFKAWQRSGVDKLHAEANKTDSTPEKLNLLQQAALLGFNDPVATEKLASDYWSMGDYNKVIDAYEASWNPLNRLYMGNLSLKANKPSSAQAFFAQADRAGESAESQAGLAKIEFINNQTANGCNHADRAKKLNLSSEPAQQASQLCAILAANPNTSVSPSRESAYVLINAYLYDLGLKQLESVQVKSLVDWQLLAKVYASRGEFDKAKDAISKGLALNSANPSLIKMSIDLNRASGKESSNQLQDQLNDLKFEKFQN